MAEVCINSSFTSNRINGNESSNTTSNNKKDSFPSIFLRETKNMDPNLSRTLLLHVRIKVFRPCKKLQNTWIKIPWSYNSDPYEIFNRCEGEFIKSFPKRGDFHKTDDLERKVSMEKSWLPFSPWDPPMRIVFTILKANKILFFRYSYCHSITFHAWLRKLSDSNITNVAKSLNELFCWFLATMMIMLGVSW